MTISATYLYQVRLNKKEMAVVNFIMKDIELAMKLSEQEKYKDKMFKPKEKRITIKDTFMVLCEYYYKKEIKSKEDNNIIKKDVPD